jgi:hypothetical protein
MNRVGPGVVLPRSVTLSLRAGLLPCTNLYYFGVAAVCGSLYSKVRWKIYGTAQRVLAAPEILGNTNR